MEKFILVGLVLIVLGTLFVVFNAAPVEVNLLITSLEIPMAVVILLSIAIGVALTLSVVFYFRYQWKKSEQDFHATIQRLEQSKEEKDDYILSLNEVIEEKNKLIDEQEKIIEGFYQDKMVDE